MRSWLLVPLFALPACDLAFGLRDRSAPDDANVVDAMPDPDVPPSCTPFSDTVNVLADTTLIHDTGGNCDPSIRFGTFINANVGQVGGMGTRSRVLLRFNLTPAMVDALAPGGGFTSATLMLPLKPNACSGPCTSAPTGVSVYPVTNTWNEGTSASTHDGAGWCMRQQSVGSSSTWQAQGADGIADRGAKPLGDLAVDATLAAADSLTIVLGASQESLMAIQDLDAWLVGNQLSLILIPTPPVGTLFTKAREDPSGGAQLTITSCR